MATRTKAWTPLKEHAAGQTYGYQHESGIRLIDIKRHPVTGYDPSYGKWNVFVPGRVFPVNAGSGSVAEWKGWIETNADRLIAEEN